MFQISFCCFSNITLHQMAVSLACKQCRQIQRSFLCTTLILGNLYGSRHARKYEPRSDITLSFQRRSNDIRTLVYLLLVFLATKVFKHVQRPWFRVRKVTYPVIKSLRCYHYP